MSRIRSNHVLASFGVFDAEDIAGNFDQVAVEFALIPFGEDIIQFCIAQTESMFEQEVRFADHLHVAVLDAVVNHLDVLTGTAWSDPFAARNIVVWTDLGSNRLELGLTSGHAAGLPRASYSDP